jgi:predicted Zn-dependent peptidase
VICGDTTEQHIQELGSLLGAPDFGVDFVQTSPETHMNKLWQTPVAHTNQASIMWGLPGLQIADKDYYGFWVLNTLLGGFFGSRLMKNIREEKGLTYGIHSSLVNHGFAYHWYISSEVKEGNVRLVNEEISKEIYRLKALPMKN